MARSPGSAQAIRVPQAALSKPPSTKKSSTKPMQKKSSKLVPGRTPKKQLLAEPEVRSTPTGNEKPSEEEWTADDWAAWQQEQKPDEEWSSAEWAEWQKQHNDQSSDEEWSAEEWTAWVKEHSLTQEWNAEDWSAWEKEQASEEKEWTAEEWAAWEAQQTNELSAVEPSSAEKASPAEEKREVLVMGQRGIFQRMRGITPKLFKAFGRSRYNQLKDDGEVVEIFNKRGILQSERGATPEGHKHEGRSAMLTTEASSQKPRLVPRAVVLKQRRPAVKVVPPTPEQSGRNSALGRPMLRAGENHIFRPLAKEHSVAAVGPTARSELDSFFELHPDFSLLRSGQVLCRVTGVELEADVDKLEAHVESEAYFSQAKRAALRYAVPHRYLDSNEAAKADAPSAAPPASPALSIRSMAPPDSVTPVAYARHGLTPAAKTPMSAAQTPLSAVSSIVPYSVSSRQSGAFSDTPASITSGYNMTPSGATPMPDDGESYTDKAARLFAEAAEPAAPELMPPQPLPVSLGPMPPLPVGLEFNEAAAVEHPKLMHAVFGSKSFVYAAPREQQPKEESPCEKEAKLGTKLLDQEQTPSSSHTFEEWETQVRAMKVVELRDALKQRELATAGKKAELIVRLLEATLPAGEENTQPIVTKVPTRRAKALVEERVLVENRTLRSRRL